MMDLTEKLWTLKNIASSQLLDSLRSMQHHKHTAKCTLVKTIQPITEILKGDNYGQKGQ